MLLPRGDFGNEAIALADAAIEALATQHANLDFNHVEPTGVLWRVMELEPLQNAMGLGCGESFV